MRDSIHKYFQVGLVSAMAYDPVLAQGGDLWPEVIRRIAVDDYFDAVEVNPLPTPEIGQQVAALAAQSHHGAAGEGSARGSRGL